MVTLFVVLTVLYPEDVSSCGSMVAADDEILEDLESGEWSETKRISRIPS